MKAFNVQNNEGGVIVFHETAGKAKYLAVRCNDWFSFDEYIDVSAKREKKADYLANDKPYCLDFCGNADVYQKLGWTCYSYYECESDSCKFKKEENNLKT